MPVVHDHDNKSVDSINLDILRVAWGGNGLAETAKEHGFESIRSLGLDGRDHDDAGYRAGFIDLVNRAEELQAAP